MELKAWNYEDIRMLRNVYGLDLGTYEIKVYDKKRDRIWKEKNVMAIEDGEKVLALGNEAYEMYEKSPDNIEIVFPMKEGEISHFHNMQYLLTNLLKNGKRRSANYVVAVPTNVTAVQKRAFYDLVIHSSARAKEVNVVERGVADAVGSGLAPQNEKGLFIANFGGETTELSVLSYGGLVLNRTLKTGGNTLDETIVNRVRRHYDFLIGRLTAESLRNEFGLFDHDGLQTISVAGRSLLSGVPVQHDISVTLVRAAIKEALDEISAAICSMLERTPPDILPDIQKNGLYVTGGLANLHGLSEYLEATTGLKTTVSKHPELSAVTGLKRIISSKELQKLTYSMSDENFMWMR